jgi:transcription initiation factor IIE alpha subunit
MSEGRLKQFAGEREDEGGESTVDNGGDKYHCTSCNDGQLVEFENAMNTQFRCGRCGNGLVFFEKRRK